MKKNRSILLALFISLGLLLGILNVYADDIPDVDDVDLSNVSVGDKFRVEVDDEEYNTYEVTEVEKDNIYIGSIKNNNKLSIYHFEINAYDEDSDSPYTSRKFVKLKDLCDRTYKENGEKLKICEITKYNDKKNGETINVQRQYINNINDVVEVGTKDARTYEELSKKVYYSTDVELESNKFKSLLYIDNGKGSTIDTDDDLDDDEKGNFYDFGVIQDGETENEQFKDGYLTGDVETLIDENDDIYVSLRFLTEALGARVDWLAKKIDNDTDAVLIRFYDSESYCKELNVTFTETNKNFEDMYNDFIKALKNQTNDMSFNMKYTYRNKTETTTGTAKWNKLFLGGFAAKNGYVFWDFDKKRVTFQYAANKSDETQYVDFQEICPSENYDENGQLETLDDCIEIIGIINYYGVPIPIELLRESNDTCTFDNDNFENIDNDYDSDYDYDENEDDNKNIVYLIGDIHVSKIEGLYSEEDIKYKTTLKYDNFEKELNNLSKNLNEDNKYTFIFNIGNTEIDEKITLEALNNGSKNNVNTYIKSLAKKYSDLYADFYKTINDNDIDADIYVIQNMPLEDTENNQFIDTFWDLLKIDNNIDVIDVNNIEFKYEDGGMTYTDETYELIFNEIRDKINLK